MTSFENSNTTKQLQNAPEDPRYQQCNKEALLGLGLGIANLLWWFFWGYGLGRRPPEEYSYILGFPDWFFMSCIVGAFLFTGLAAAMVQLLFKDMPLETTNEEPEQTG